MKKYNLIAALFLLISIPAYSAFVTVVKEKPSSPKLGRTKTVYVGWLALPEDNWKTYGYESKKIWKDQIQANNRGIVAYLKEKMPDRVIKGTRSKPSKGDIYVSLKYFNLKRTYKVTPFGVDELKVGVEFIDIKSGKSLYKAVVVLTGGGRFPRNWKGSTFDGRVDNMMFNIAGFIASKL